MEPQTVITRVRCGFCHDEPAAEQFVDNLDAIQLACALHAPRNPDLRATVTTPPALDADMWAALRSSYEGREAEAVAWARVRDAGVVGADGALTELGKRVVEALPLACKPAGTNWQGLALGRFEPEWPH
jgi:hypothetical protein